MDLGFLSDELSGDKRQDRLQGYHPERKPQHARDGGQCETFNQELACYAGRCGSQRKADSDFASARHDAC